MRPIILIAFLTLIVACKKENKGPVCRFSMIGSNGGIKSPVTYPRGDTIAVISGDYGYTLYFSEQGRLLRKETPITDPYRRYELGYNIFGQVSELRYYGKQGGNSWVPEAKRAFIYDRGKMVRVGQPGDRESYEIIWQGNDIKAVVYWFDQQVQCTVTFTYDGTILNPNRQFNYFYFVDNNSNDVNFKLPYYFSQHLLTKQETTCWVEEPKNFTYTFTPDGFIASVTIQQGIGTGSIWEYEYECR
ncbi:MAG: hypothetical protein ABIP10_19315 [Ferruginibacter sp.]